MTKRRIAWMALSLAIASTLGNVSPAIAEETTIDADKVYTQGTLNGENGYWVELTRYRFSRNQFVVQNPIGRYDATIQEAFQQTIGLNRALTAAEMSAIYTKYGIPLASNATYDGAAYHDFNWNAALSNIKNDLTAGRLTAARASASNLNTMALLANAQDSSALVDALGASTLDSYIKKAFDFNEADALAKGSWAGAAGYRGGEYTYDASDGAHFIGYAHGVSYVNSAQVDATVLSRDSNRSIQDVLLNSSGDFKKLLGVGMIDSYTQAGRFIAMADLIDKGINPAGLAVDTWVNTSQGPVHLMEDQPTSARLKDIARFLIASSWTTHSPIALDLNHDGKIGVTGPSTAQKRLHKNKFEPQGAVYFDIMANGKKQHIEWLNGDGDGFLVDDANSRVSKAQGGVIDAHSLFGDAIGYSNGYHKLAYKSMKTQVAAVFSPTDSSNWNSLFKKKPVLKSKDMKDLKVWVDSNRDAVVQPKELRTLQSLGVTEIGTVPAIRKNVHGEYTIQSYFVQNGKRHMTEDVWFAEDPTTADKQ